MGQRPDPDPRATSPLVLVHGIARLSWLFDAFQARALAASPERAQRAETLADGTHYFRGVASLLRSRGYTVSVARLGFASSVETRSSALGTHVREVLAGSGAARVHLIAHSMGGLDARHLVVDEPELASRVASITTLGTPHHGTLLAALGLRFGGRVLTRALRPWVQLEGFEDLAPGPCRVFNQRAEAIEAANSIRYCTWSSVLRSTVQLGPLESSRALLWHLEGPNDGLVARKSQSWCTHLQGLEGQLKKVEQRHVPFPASHLDQIGWGRQLMLAPVRPRTVKEVQSRDYRWIYLQMAASCAATDADQGSADSTC